MGAIGIVKETLDIIKNKQYIVKDVVVALPKEAYEMVEVYSPEKGVELLDWDMAVVQGEKLCEVSVVNEDSFQAARRFNNPFVMNFANAHTPGGGFLLGANAQEEALCRCSTLYVSISSKEASEMYKYNNSHLSNVESDYMLLSPQVYVFRDEKYNLLETPVKVAVITIPAPNRFGAAMFASGQKIEETMLRRIRIMLRIAVQKDYKNLVLGAWGCGAFGNDANAVAGYFKQVLVDEGYGRCFEHVCFAVYGKPDGRNINAFRKVWNK